jgi:hypothetical protein
LFRNAGDLSLSITVPCMPFTDIEKTAKRCALIFGSEMNIPCASVSARIFGTRSVGTCVFSIPRMPSGLPGWSPCTSKTPSSSIATSGTFSSRAIFA